MFRLQAVTRLLTSLTVRTPVVAAAVTAPNPLAAHLGDLHVNGYVKHEELARILELPQYEQAQHIAQLWPTRSIPPDVKAVLGPTYLAPESKPFDAFHDTPERVLVARVHDHGADRVWVSFPDIVSGG